MIERVAARVLVIDDASAVLLLQGMDPARPDRGSWWFTPGGGLDEGETPAEGARRELFEETGLRVAELGPVVFTRDLEFEFEGLAYHQFESFFAVHVARFEPVADHWSELERRVMLGYRWWTADEILRTSETIYPENLADLLRADLDDE